GRAEAPAPRQPFVARRPDRGAYGGPHPPAQRQPHAEPQSRARVEQPRERQRADLPDQKLGDRGARSEKHRAEESVNNPCVHGPRKPETFAFSAIYARIRRGWPGSGDRNILITLRGDVE